MRQSTLLFWVSLVLSIGLFSPVYGQEDLQAELDALDQELDAIFGNESDSLSLMSLVDSLVNMDADYSELQFRLGYSSRVTSAGRDFGIDQQGLTPGISYYHKSGLYADVSGFWNSELDPKYNLTIATLGYLGRIKSKTTYSFTYDHSFYTTDDPYNTLTNSVSGAITHYFKHFYTGVDYSFSFGSETANRVIWNVTGMFNTKGFGPFRRVSILPSVAILFGNQNITNQYVNPNAINRFDGLTDRQLLIMSRNRNLSRLETASLFQLRNRALSGEITEQELGELSDYFTTEESYKTFDLLNYYLTLPVVFYGKSFNVYLSYNYNIPRNLSNTITYEPNGYFGFAVTYNLRL